MKRPGSSLDREENFNKIQKKAQETERELCINNLFSNEGIEDIKLNLINRLIESNSFYQSLITLRRTSKWYHDAIDDCLTKTLNERYKSEDCINHGFEILNAAVPFRIPRCLTQDLQPALVLYFHAQRNRDQAACLAFINLFDAHLESLKSNFQETGFQFSCEDKGEDFDFNFDQFQIDIDQPFSAYLFTHFLNRFLTSKQFNQLILKATTNDPWVENIIDFLDTHSDLNTVPRIIEEIILKLSQIIAINPLKKETKEGVLKLFLNILLREIIDKTMGIKSDLVRKIAPFLLSHPKIVVPSLEKCGCLEFLDLALVKELELVEKITSLFSSPFLDEEMLCDIFFCLDRFAQEKLIDPSLVYNLTEKISSNFKHPKLNVKNSALACVTVFVDEGLIDLSLEKKLDLIERIAFALPSPKALSCLEGCASKGLINNFHLTWLLLVEKLVAFLSDKDADVSERAFLCMDCFINAGLIDLNCVKHVNLIETLISILSDKNFKAFWCMRDLAEKGLIDLSLATNHNLIEKIASFLPDWNAINCLIQFAEKDLIDPALVTKLELVKKMGAHAREIHLTELASLPLCKNIDWASLDTKLYQDVASNTIDCLLKFVEKGWIDRSLVMTLNLPEVIIGSIGFVFTLQNQSWHDAAWSCKNGLHGLRVLAENGFIDSATVSKLNLVEKIRSFLSITQFGINKYAASCLKIFEDKGLISDNLSGR